MPKIIERALDALDSLDGEAQRKVEYITEQLLYGRREPADEAMLIESLGRIVR